MVERRRGNPRCAPYPGSVDQRRREREERRRHLAAQRRARRYRERALRAADFRAAEAVFPAEEVRRLAEANLATMDDVHWLAERLNREGDGSWRWDGWSVAHCIALLWPAERSDRWPRRYGTYPGYLGGFRDRWGPLPGAAQPVPPRRGFPVAGPLGAEHSCPRCGARWPDGWPGTEASEASGGRCPCPDCGFPFTGVRVPAREHSVIDLHWLRFRFAPEPPGPCPVCGEARVLDNPFRGGPYRTLVWSCPSPEARASLGVPEGHGERSLAPARFASEAAHYAYWLAVDMLRVLAANGEVTEVPPGARYEARDGSGACWRYDGQRWERTGPADRGG